MTPRILIAGIGNIFLGDDGFGSEVARRLLRRPQQEGVQVMDVGIRGFDLTYALLDGVDVAIFIDATPRGGPPGTLYVIEHEFEAMPAHPAEAAIAEAHGMNPMKVLRLAATMGTIPRRVLIVGCEPTPLHPEDTQLGLSDPVSNAIDSAIEAVESLVTKLRGPQPAETMPASSAV